MLSSNKVLQTRCERYHKINNGIEMYKDTALLHLREVKKNCSRQRGTKIASHLLLDFLCNHMVTNGYKDG